MLRTALEWRVISWFLRLLARMKHLFERHAGGDSRRKVIPGLETERRLTYSSKCVPEFDGSREEIYRISKKPGVASRFRKMKFSAVCATAVSAHPPRLFQHFVERARQLLGAGVIVAGDGVVLALEDEVLVSDVEGGEHRHTQRVHG